MTRIAWIPEDEAHGELAELYGQWRKQNPGRGQMPDILMCFSSNPRMMSAIMEMSYGVHFCEGALTRRVKEMIATLVSALNRCHY